MPRAYLYRLNCEHCAIRLKFPLNWITRGQAMISLVDFLMQNLHFRDLYLTGIRIKIFFFVTNNTLPPAIIDPSGPCFLLMQLLNSNQIVLKTRIIGIGSFFLPHLIASARVLKTQSQVSIIILSPNN